MKTTQSEIPKLQINWKPQKIRFSVGRKLHPSAREVRGRVAEGSGEKKDRKDPRRKKERNIKKLLEMFVEAEIKLHVIYTAEEKIDLYCPSTTTPALLHSHLNFIAEKL